MHIPLMTIKAKRTLIASLILIIIGGFFAYAFIYRYLEARQEARSAMYPEFGIEMPEQYQIHGIDVSRYQQYIYWKAVKQMQVRNIKIGFAFIKATEGTDRVDSYFKRNWKKAKQENLTIGAYHFFVPGKSGKQQAELFIQTVKLQPGDLPPVLDIELTSGVDTKQLKKELSIFLQALESHYKIKPIIYSNVDFYEKHLGEAFDSYPLWIAHYIEHNKPRIKRNWLFWQHSDKGKANGIKADVDFNVFNGDSAAFKSLLLK